MLNQSSPGEKFLTCAFDDVQKAKNWLTEGHKSAQRLSHWQEGGGGRHGGWGGAPYYSPAQFWVVSRSPQHKRPLTQRSWLPRASFLRMARREPYGF